MDAVLTNQNQPDALPSTRGERAHFIKYHGLGNDFAVFVGGMSGLETPPAPTVRMLCHRGKGIGADGIILARPSPVATVRMELVNSDGSIPQMCGNGLRCFVKYVVEELGIDANPLPVETVGGIRRCFYNRGDDGVVTSVRVDMGRPSFERAVIPVVGDGEALRIDVASGDRSFTATGVNTGNPHMVLFLDDTPGDQLVPLAATYGPALEVHPLWPQKANVEFVRVADPRRLEVAVWERGCGLTQACGTGATASVAAACKLGKAPFDTPVTVALPGGELRITVESDFRTAWMDGPVTEVYRASMAATELA